MKKAVIALSIIAAVAIGLDVFFMVRSNTAVQNIATQYPYLDPYEAGYSDTDLLVNMYPLAQQLNALAGGNPNIDIYFQYLNTGSDIRIGTTPLYPGSLMKIPIAMAVMKKIESGDWSMDTELTLTDADKNQGTARCISFLRERSSPSAPFYTTCLWNRTTRRAIFLSAPSGRRT